MKLTALCAAAAVAAATLFPLPNLSGETTDARANQLPLRYQEANGNVVGRAAWREATPLVIMQEGKRTFGVVLWPTVDDALHLQYVGTSVYFEKADCSGEAYLLRDDESLTGISLAAVLKAGDGRVSIVEHTSTSPNRWNSPA